MKQSSLFIVISLLLTAISTAPALAGEIYPIIDADYSILVGTWEKPYWLDNEMALSRGVNNNHFRLYNLDGLQATATGGQAMFMEPPFEFAVEVPLTPEPARDGLVGIDCPWEPMPRPVQQAATTQQAYIDATAAILAELGLPGAMPSLQQVLRMDLDGDGTDEVLVAATRYNRGELAVVDPGDYSLVYLRRLVNGQVKTQILFSEVYQKHSEGLAPLTFSIRAVLDLNGDGTMEVLTHSEYYEGYSLDVWELGPNGLELVLTAGLGV